MTEAEFKIVQEQNTQAVAQGKPPLIAQITPENVSQAAPENIPSMDDYLQLLAQLRGLRWAKLGSMTLQVPATSMDINISPRKHLLIRVRVTGKSSATPVVIRFNGDTGTNYIYIVTAANTSVDNINLSNTSTTDDTLSTVEIDNQKNVKKIINYLTTLWSGTAGGSISKIQGAGAWDNAVSQITSISIVANAGGGVTFGAGSFVDVYGMD